MTAKEPKTKPRPWPVPNEIVQYFHCGMCMDERPEDQSPREWSSIEVGATVRGIQVMCKRHGVNIIHMDFQGTKHPAICFSHMKKEDYASF